ncbi:MAG: glycosyltransferase family 9 protein [Acidobacteriaceae bacterium]|jgi:ADP-heptose:LPS heptosyltransferase
MVRSKYLKLYRKFLGSVVRPKFGIKNQLTRGFKVLYLLSSAAIEIVVDTVYFWRSRNRQIIANPRRILVIKVDQLGDILFSTLLVPAIKSRYPQAQIDFLIRPGAECLLSGNPGIARVYRWNNVVLDLLPGRGRSVGIMEKIRENLGTRKALRGNGYDVAINARAYPPSSNFFWSGLAKVLIAFDISEQSSLADRWADYDLDAEDWRNYANLLSPLGIPPSDVGLCGEFFNCDAANPMNGKAPYAVISPITFDKDRQWKPEHWASLIAGLSSLGVNVALTGMPSQHEYLEQIALPALQREGRVLVFTNLQIPEFGALMKDAAVFVGIDSFPAHLALALNRPVRLLMNNEVYFLKGYSQPRFASEARSMISVHGLISFFDVKSALPDELIASCRQTIRERTGIGVSGKVVQA